MCDVANPLEDLQSLDPLEDLQSLDPSPPRYLWISLDLLDIPHLYCTGYESFVELMKPP